MTLDVLLYALIAAGLVFWLRNVLGTRHGDERQRPNPFARNDQAGPVRPPHNTATRPATSSESFPGVLPGVDEALPGTVMPIGKNMVVAPGVEPDLLALSQSDHTFNATQFLEGAQEAFVMIVEAFAECDRALLKNLLDPPLYTAFDGAMTARENRGETALTEIHAIRRAEIVEARIHNKRALITGRFAAEETATVHDKDGHYISGNPDRVKETIDIWTFGRALKSREHTWYLLATREEDADKKGMPEGEAPEGSSTDDATNT